MRDLANAAMICLEAIPDGTELGNIIDLKLQTAYDLVSEAYSVLEKAIDAADNLAAEVAADDVAGDQSSG